MAPKRIAITVKLDSEFHIIDVIRIGKGHYLILEWLFLNSGGFLSFRHGPNIYIGHKFLLTLANKNSDLPEALSPQTTQISTARQRVGVFEE